MTQNEQITMGIGISIGCLAMLLIMGIFYTRDTILLESNVAFYDSKSGSLMIRNLNHSSYQECLKTLEKE